MNAYSIRSLDGHWDHFCALCWNIRIRADKISSAEGKFCSGCNLLISEVIPAARELPRHRFSGFYVTIDSTVYVDSLGFTVIPELEAIQAAQGLQAMFPDSDIEIWSAERISQ